MKKRIIMLVSVLLAFTAGLTLVVMGGVSGYTVMKKETEVALYNANDSYNYTAYKINTTVYIAPKGPFCYKYVKARRTVYNGRFVTQDYCIIRGTVGNFEEKHIAPDPPDKVEVDIVGCKGTNVAPIVIGSILMAGAIALFVLLEIKQQKRLRTAEATVTE